MKTQTTEFLIAEIERIAAGNHYANDQETFKEAAKELAERVKTGRLGSNLSDPALA